MAACAASSSEADVDVRQGQDLRPRRLPGGRGGRERHGRQRHEPARQLHVRQPAAARPQGPGRRRSRHHHLRRHGDADPADRHHHRDRPEGEDRRPDLRVPDGARLRGAVGDAVVHRGEEGDRGRRGRDPHAAQHLFAARRQDPRAAALVEVPQPGPGDVGRQGRGDLRPAPLADLGQRQGRRAAEEAARPLPLHQRRDPAHGQPGHDDARDRRAASSCRTASPTFWANRGYYGSVYHDVAATYVLYLGWFDGNPATLHELPPVEASKKLRRVHGRRRRGAGEGQGSPTTRASTAGWRRW